MTAILRSLTDSPWAYLGPAEVGIIAEDIPSNSLLYPYVATYPGQYLRLLITAEPTDPLTVYDDGTYDYTYVSGTRTMSFDLYVDGVFNRHVFKRLHQYSAFPRLRLRFI